MRRFKDILVVAPKDTDMTEPMLAAGRLAAANRARITVFDALEPVTLHRSAGIGSYGPAYIRRLIEEARRTELEEVARLVPEVRVRTALATGTPFLEVIRRVLTHDHDLVVLPPDQPRGLVGLARASTTMHLLRKCPVPVWVCRPEIPATGDVMAAVGPFEDGMPSALDRKLVEMGSSLAERQGSRFHLVHAWSLEGESLLRNGRVRMRPADVDHLASREETTARDGVAKLVAEVGLDPAGVAVHVVKGKPVAAITEIAERVDPGVVVMGTLARSGVSGLFIGNTAESTLGVLRSSIIAVKPDGFRSPVETVAGEAITA